MKRIELGSGRVTGFRDVGSGPILVQIHGIGTGHQNFDALTPILAEHLQVVDVDLPGYNESDRPSAAERSIDGFADAVAEFLRTQQFGPVASSA